MRRVIGPRPAYTFSMEVRGFVICVIGDVVRNHLIRVIKSSSSSLEATSFQKCKNKLDFLVEIERWEMCRRGFILTEGFC
jgi:hypothetical protein